MNENYFYTIYIGGLKSYVKNGTYSLNQIYSMISNKLAYDLKQSCSKVNNFEEFKGLINKTITILFNNKVAEEAVWRKIFDRVIYPTCNEKFKDKIPWVNTLFYIYLIRKVEEPKKDVEFKHQYQKELDFMGLYYDFTKEDLRKKFAELSLKYHPDKGGDQADFIKLVKCKETLENSLK